MSTFRKWHDDPIAFNDAVTRCLRLQQLLGEDEFITNLSMAKQDDAPRDSTSELKEASVETLDTRADDFVPSAQSCTVRMRRVWHPTLRRWITVSEEVCS